MIRLSLFWLLCLFSLVTQASAIDSLRAFVQKAQTFKAVFSQTLLDKNLQVVQEASGVMMFERPGKFRWTYEKPYQQLIVGDGAKVWFYDQDLNQVTVRQLDLAIGSSPAALLAGSSTIERDFDLTEIEVDDEIEWLEATPKAQESTFELIRMGFSQTGELREMVLRDNFGQFTLLVFTDLAANPVLAPDLFQFTPPEGADVISD
jgi:outer membrane lipoprotein carrier protein